MLTTQLSPAHPRCDWTAAALTLYFTTKILLCAAYFGYQCAIKINEVLYRHAWNR
jgi:hypothetical protein